MLAEIVVALGSINSPRRLYRQWRVHIVINGCFVDNVHGYRGGISGVKVKDFCAEGYP